MDFKREKFIYISNISSFDKDIKFKIMKHLDENYLLLSSKKIKSRNSMLVAFPKKVNLNEIVEFVDKELGESSRVNVKKVLEIQDNNMQIEVALSDMRIFVNKNDLYI